MAIAMTTGYSAQTEGAQLCIEAASDWALTCVDHLDDQSNHVLIDYGAADGGPPSVCGLACLIACTPVSPKPTSR